MILRSMASISAGMLSNSIRIRDADSSMISNGLNRQETVGDISIRQRCRGNDAASYDTTPW
jgi:hypothetical protein